MVKKLFIILIFLLLSCNKQVGPQTINNINQYPNAVSLKNIYSTYINNYSCNDSLPSEELVITVKGFLYKSNIFINENRFFLYSDTLSSQINECNLSPSFLNIYNTITKLYSKQTSYWMPIVVKGHLIGINLQTNGNCKKSFKINNICEVGLSL